MTAIEMLFEHEKSTKNTERYREVGAGSNPTVLYLRKADLPKDVPVSIKIEIREA